MKNNAQLWDDIYVALGPRRQPAGVRFLYTPGQYEAAGVKELTRAVSYCNMVRMAGLGKSFKGTQAHSACPGGSIGTGLMEQNMYKRTGNSYSPDNLWLYDTIGTARQVLEDMLFMPADQYGLELRPLSGYLEHDPDVVIFVLNPFDAMRLIQGYSFHYGMKKDFRLSGNQAFCSELTAVPYRTNGINLSTLCSGTRHRCNWDSGELAVGVAYNKLPMLVDGLMATIAETEPKKRKLAITARAEEKGLSLDVRHGREYFLRTTKRDW